MRTERMECEVLVIGSGPGGATTACLLAEAGVDVILAEEGSHLALDSAPAHSIEEMDQKWRNGGMTPTFGAPKVTYIEGRCVGGASETNAGLYHRPMDVTLDGWRDEYGLEGFGAQALAPYLAETETELSVSHMPDDGAASRLVKAGAEALGWKSKPTAKFWKYQQNPDGSWTGRRQSMTETMIPRALAAGCRLCPDTRMERLVVRNGSAASAVGTSRPADGEPVRREIAFKQVFLCAGAIQTPLLLRRSGISSRIGDTLTLNPMVRLAARFPDEINDPHLGIPPEQIEEFKPKMTLGCSHSALPHLALWLSGSGVDKAGVREMWRTMGVFYAKIMPAARGSVRNLPVFGEPFVRYPILQDDLDHLSEGLYRLGRLLFAAGAVEVYNPIKGAPSITDPAHLDRFKGALTAKNVSVSAIHLHSTCHMGGESHPTAATDSYGRLRGYENVAINDSSLLPDTPGINPQGTIVAIARRNVRRYLDAR